MWYVASPFIWANARFGSSSYWRVCVVCSQALASNIVVVVGDDGEISENEGAASEILDKIGKCAIFLIECHVSMGNSTFSRFSSLPHSII